MKRSKSITLVLLGTATLLAGCDDGTEQVQVKQQQYASRADCLQDWGNDERNCTPAPAGGGGYYYGPRYYWDHSAGYPMVIDNSGAQRPVPTARFSESSTSTSSMAKSFSSSTARVPATSSIGRAASVARGGFGGTGAHFSAGG